MHLTSADIMTKEGAYLMTYDDFMKILDDTQSMIISKDLFKTLLDSQIPDRITAEEKKRIYDDGYNMGYKQAIFDMRTGGDKE